MPRRISSGKERVHNAWFSSRPNPVLQSQPQSVESGPGTLQNSSFNAVTTSVAATHKSSPSGVSSLPETGDSNEAGVIADLSSDEDELVGAGVILSSAFNGYTLDRNSDTGRKVAKLVSEICQSGAITCLICISSVKRIQPIWSCTLCYCIYHLQCIQSWANEYVNQIVLKSEEFVDKQQLSWDCPKCRQKYAFSDIPQTYTCYCGSTSNPAPNPWSIPHSCGQMCHKPLKPLCGHDCTLLCHPGPCPPCPQMVQHSCHCARSPPVSRRCSAKTWACQNVCGATLNCGKHTCTLTCHPGNCPTCTQVSIQRCDCEAKSQLRLCAEPRWRCGAVCGRPYSCGHHSCTEVCHRGDCGRCPQEGERTCPCGNTRHHLPCTDEVPTCFSTCDKYLACGLHKCQDKCHYRECGQCTERVLKSCPCGARSKSIPCPQSFTCEVKCTRFRSCLRHQCKRKCCLGDCPPCKNQCNKQLNCSNHKCQALCHSGPCYPCQSVKTLSCDCGATSFQVACGREKVVRPPKCQELCKKPVACHHTEPYKHRCHQGPCPPCPLVCAKVLVLCQHKCLAKCHSAIWTRTQPKLFSFEPVALVQVEQPCPPCRTMVDITCVGLHHTKQVHCSEAHPFSCGSPCGRILPCTHHICLRTCHALADAPDQLQASPECDVCQSLCSVPRPAGCPHPCQLACHAGPCQACERNITQPCRCGHLSLLIKCSTWTSSSAAERLKMRDGAHPCLKEMACGHMCPLGCHLDDCCQQVKDCVRSTLVKCACGRIKEERICNEVTSGQHSILPCDQICQQRREKRLKRQRDRHSTSETMEPMPKEEEQHSTVQSSPKGKSVKAKDRLRRTTRAPRAGSTWAFPTYYFPLSLALLAILVALYISISADLS